MKPSTFNPSTFKFPRNGKITSDMLLKLVQLVLNRKPISNRTCRTLGILAYWPSMISFSGNNPANQTRVEIWARKNHIKVEITFDDRGLTKVIAAWHSRRFDK